MFQVVVYSKKESGDIKLSKNFQVREFACKDGSDVILIDPLLIWILQNVRDYFGKPVNITSGYRTITHNRAVSGSSSDSYHTRGMAADFVVSGVEASEVQAYLEIVMAGVGGIGKADDYTHVDTRPEKARWNY